MEIAKPNAQEFLAEHQQNTQKGPKAAQPSVLNDFILSNNHIKLIIIMHSTSHKGSISGKVVERSHKKTQIAVIAATACFLCALANSVNG